MEFKMTICYSWWWKPAFKLVYAISVCRLIPDKTTEAAVNFILRNAFKWRIGRGEWRRISDFQIKLERQ